MHIVSLCRVRSDTMDITCHPNIFLHVGSPQVPNSDPHVMVLLSNVPWSYRSDAGDSMMDISFLKFCPTVERR